MILRRVIEHFRKQEWTAIFLDFIIVVVGVFVGLQVNNWNEARKDRALESAYLAGIAADLESDIDEIDEIARIARVRFAALGFLLTEADGKPLPDGFESARGRIEIEPAPPFAPEETGTAGIVLFQLTTLEGHRLAYETMINAGGVGLIRDTGLLRQIQGYYAVAQSIRDFEDDVKISSLDLVRAQQAAGLAAIDETPAPALAAAFADNPSLLAAAKNYWLYTNRHLKLMGDLREIAVALLDRIEGESKP